MEGDAKSLNTSVFIGNKKVILGIALILIACISLVYWEVSGRETLLMESVYVAKQNIKESTYITEEMVIETKIIKGERVEGALDNGNISSIFGKKVNRDIIKNSQMSKLFFTNKKLNIKKYQSIYVIKGEWIDMISSALRKGDKVKIYENHIGEETTSLLLGEFEIAFVKDSTSREVVSVNDMGETLITDRQDSSSVIEHIEIICTLQDYEIIRQKSQQYESPFLTIVHDLEV